MSLSNRILLQPDVPDSQLHGPICKNCLKNFKFSLLSGVPDGSFPSRKTFSAVLCSSFNETYSPVLIQLTAFKMISWGAAIVISREQSLLLLVVKSKPPTFLPVVSQRMLIGSTTACLVSLAGWIFETASSFDIAINLALHHINLDPQRKTLKRDCRTMHWVVPLNFAEMLDLHLAASQLFVDPNNDLSFPTTVYFSYLYTACVWKLY